MIPLHPLPDSYHDCPYCQVALKARGWYVPGMRNLADLSCERCGREFYGDLTAGQALYTPLLLEKETGQVFDPYDVHWFAEWLRKSYSTRTDSPLPFTAQECKPLGKQAVLLNCLDTLYGHSLLKLLNAQYYLDQRPDLDLIIMIPRFLEWMVPEGAAEVWIVDLPLRHGTEWNDWLARKIHQRIERRDTCHLGIAFSHPHPDDYSIERFTGVRPFPIDEWESRLEKQATVTFIWREDRLWDESAATTKSDLFASARLNALKQRVTNNAASLREQRRRVLSLANALREKWPTLDFAVVGLGVSSKFPAWMSDLRVEKVDAATERAWCERYASSHVVIGIHGSNMLLPSAHAGAVIELMPSERWGNFLQDILYPSYDCRETLFRCRIVPASVTPWALAQLLDSMLRHHDNLQLTMGSEFCRHQASYEVARWRAPQRKSLQSVK